MRSIILWRMIVIFFITVLLTSLLMTGGYMYLSLDAYTAIKLSELTPEADAIGQLYLEYRDAMIDTEAFTRILDRLIHSSSNSRCIIADVDGNFVYQTKMASEYSEEYDEAIKREFTLALSGTTVERDRFITATNDPALSVCVPIYDSANRIQGAVFLQKSFTEIHSTTNKLNRSLFRAMLMVLPIMLLISSFSLRRVTEPLHKMGEVAVAMRGGDFEARADESQKGEIGLLARALNDLCDSLSQTIHQLRAEKGQLKQILASFSEGVAATDGVGCLTHYNAALMQMFGTVRVDTRHDLIPDAGIWEVFDSVYQNGEAHSMRYPLPGGRMLWITISPVVTEDGERAGVVGLFKDMTDVENLERTRREYVANISHELRTPLTAMRGLLEPLIDGLVTGEEDRQRYYKIMQREVLRLSRLVTDMLQLSRLQSGTAYMEMVEVDINEVLEDIIQNYTQKCMERDISLVLETDILPRVLTDPDRVEQVLIILLDNALRFTPEGGSIIIRANAFERVNISVIDTGPGISQDDIGHIFERFYTVDKSRKQGGTGLGLSIAQQIIMKLGEKIMVESEQGVGSCFTFTLRKFVVNAIALGPAQEEWDYLAENDQLPPLLKPQITPHIDESLDAEYEVLPGKEKKQEKKRKNL